MYDAGVLGRGNCLYSFSFSSVCRFGMDAYSFKAWLKSISSTTLLKFAFASGSVLTEVFMGAGDTDDGGGVILAFSVG